MATWAGRLRNIARAARVVRAVPDVNPDAITFYWRPGCGFCMGLERRLEKLGVPFEKHNIWEDPEAAAVVRGIANGNETVPTVVIGEARLVNPSADAVLAAVRQHAPHLDPGDAPQGALRRFLDR
ncbi:MAG TPA: glutaredoxin domain-containing protein [Acidimicrobiales bacterium]